MQTTPKPNHADSLPPRDLNVLVFQPGNADICSVANKSKWTDAVSLNWSYCTLEIQRQRLSAGQSVKPHVWISEWLSRACKVVCIACHRRLTFCWYMINREENQLHRKALGDKRLPERSISLVTCVCYCFGLFFLTITATITSDINFCWNHMLNK